MKNVPAKFKSWKILPLTKMIPVAICKLSKRSQAAVATDKNGVPKLFFFSTFALLDLLSKIDAALVDKLSSEEYHDRSVNPAGWLIDAIESKLPPDPDFVHSLEKSIIEAQKKGWIPFDKIVKEFHLA